MCLLFVNIPTLAIFYAFLPFVLPNPETSPSLVKQAVEEAIMIYFVVKHFH